MVSDFPTNSTTASTPSGTSWRTWSVIEPLSMTTWSAPASSRARVLSGLRVVAMTVAPSHQDAPCARRRLETYEPPPNLPPLKR